MSSESSAEVEALRARVRELEALCQGVGAGAGQPPLLVLLENAPDSITLLDRGGRLRYLNRTFAPRTVAEVLGQRAIEFMPPEFHAPFERALERAFQSGEVQHIEVKTVTGGYVWETRLVPLRGAEGVHAVMGIGADVTQRRAAEQALQEARKLEAVGRIAADLAHNFNNLLLVIITNLAVCKARAPEELASRLQEVENATQRAAELVRKLMLLARKKSRSQQLAPARLEAIVARTVEMCRTAFDASVEITLETHAELSPVRVDAVEIEQALLNVLLNARDALESKPPAAPKVQITLDMAHMPRIDTGPQRPAVRIRVSDNGPGMDEHVRSRVFEPFFTTKAESGTGLGLAMTYATMVDHEGLILCESSPGAGATFTLLFPAA